MYNFFEFLKQFSPLKKFGRKLLKLRECYFRFVADEEMFAKYQKEHLAIPGCRDGDVHSISNEYLQGNILMIKEKLVVYYDALTLLVDEKVKQGGSYTIMRVGDGEANFLRNVVRGNTASRHFTTGKRPTQEYIDLFKNGLLESDSIHREMYKSVRRSFEGIYGRDIFSTIPLECIYAMIASRKIFSTPYKIGIIGSEKKIEIMKQLFTHEEYRVYIGRDKFDHYIPIPERGSSNDVVALSKEIVASLDPSVDIYLVGIGIAKLAVFPELKKHGSAVFLDVGCGVSALAGLVSNTRPYFADWINFRLKDYDYSSVDTIDADMFLGGKVYV